MVRDTDKLLKLNLNELGLFFDWIMIDRFLQWSKVSETDGGGDQMNEISDDLQIC